MSFARKIKSWGLAKVANVAKEEASEPCTEQSLATLATLARVGASKSEAPTAVALATLATLARPPVSFSDAEQPQRAQSVLSDALRQQGLSDREAAAFAAKLDHRQADLDDRRVCLECRYLIGQSICNNALRAGLSVTRRTTSIAQGQAIQLQRCPGFGLKAVH